MKTTGFWSVTSEKDPRWNGSGSGYVGGLVMPAEAKAYVEKKKEELGEPPDDLAWGYMKD